MNKVYLSSLFVLLSVVAAAQINIARPVPIPFDSARLAKSQLCFNDSIQESASYFDMRMYRFRAFSDYKVIRIADVKRKGLIVDVYSFALWKDSLLYHKQYKSADGYLRIKQLLSQYHLLDLPGLDYDDIIALSLPVAQCGTNYEVEVKAAKAFTYKFYNNPEMYTEGLVGQAPQAVAFTSFISEVEKLTGLPISIAEPLPIKKYKVSPHIYDLPVYEPH